MRVTFQSSTERLIVDLSPVAMSIEKSECSAGYFAPNGRILARRCDPDSMMYFDANGAHATPFSTPENIDQMSIGGINRSSEVFLVGPSAEQIIQLDSTGGVAWKTPSGSYIGATPVDDDVLALAVEPDKRSAAIVRFARR